MPHLEQWQISPRYADTPEDIILVGEVSGDDLRQDGTVVRTPRLKNIDWENRRAVTANDVVYTLGVPQKDYRI